MSLIKKIENSLEPLSKEKKKKIDRKLSLIVKPTDYSKKKDMCCDAGAYKISKNKCETLNFANTEYNLRVKDRGSFHTDFINTEYNNKIEELNNDVDKIKQNIEQNVNLLKEGEVTTKVFVKNFNKYFNQLLNQYQSVINTLVEQYSKAKSSIDEILFIHNTNLVNFEKIHHKKLVGNCDFEHVGCVNMKQKNPITTSKLHYYIKADKEKTDRAIQTDDFKEQDKELNKKDAQTTQPTYEINNVHNIQILEQQKPKYEINKMDNINITDITEEKKSTEDKKIQTDDVQLKENEVQVNIEDKQKKVVQKPKKKFNWNFNHFQPNINKDKYCSFERVGDIFGYRNPSNLMISSGKSPFRNYDKNKDVGLQPWKCGQNNNQGWRI